MHDDRRVQLATYVPRALADAVHKAAASADLSASQYMRRALTKVIADRLDVTPHERG